MGNTLDGRMINSLNTIDVYSLPFPHFDSAYQRYIGAISSKENRSRVPHNVLAHHRWGTSIHTVSETMKVTTQRGLRYLQGPLTRRFRTRQKTVG
jgi:hypothetical protein